MQCGLGTRLGTALALAVVATSRAFALATYTSLPNKEMLFKLQRTDVRGQWQEIIYDRKFCLSDSDQDGMSNGMELGGKLHSALPSKASPNRCG